MKTKFLANKQFEVNGEKVGRLTWYTPLEYLKEYDGVIEAEHDEITSSAGDWSGHIIQKYRGSYWLMFFSQENHEYSFEVNIGEAIKLCSKNKNSANEEANGLNKLGIDYNEGNDAPRGGKEGEFICLSKKGLLQTKDYRDNYTKTNI